MFGPQTLHRLPELIRKRELTGRSQVDIFPEIEKFDHLPPAHPEGATGLCFYHGRLQNIAASVLVPRTRGEEVSRPLNDILVEAHLTLVRR